jgi:CheY-like chemotaxis protein
MLPRIFDLFAQADQSLARTQGGLGIGLSLVRSLVELHGGRVSAQSSGLGQGSEFFVHLPLSTTMQPRRQPATGSVAEKSPVPQSANGESSRDRVLVVDDSIDIAESMSMLLSLSGFDVKTAITGHEALDIAASFLPSAILLDIGMPELDGYQVCQLMRQQPGLEETLLIAVTGYGSKEDRARARAAGFDHYLLKPVEPKALQMLLRKAPPSHLRATPAA